MNKQRLMELAGMENKSWLEEQDSDDRHSEVKGTLKNEDAPNISYNIGNGNIEIFFKQTRIGGIQTNEGTETLEGRRNTAKSLEQRLNKLQQEIANAIAKIEQDFN